MHAAHRRRSRLVASGIVVLISVGLYYLLQPVIGEKASAVSVMPVAVIATFYGTRAGLVASAVAFPFNTFLLQALSSESPVVSLFSSAISISLFGVAWLFGRFHALRVQLGEARRGRHRAETALKMTEDRLRGFLQTTPDLILRLGAGGRLLEMQGEHNLALDIRKEDHLFRPLDSLLPAAVADRILSEASLVNDEGRRRVLISFPSEDGERLMSVTLVPSGDREVMALVRPAGEGDEAE